jgi:hypothetical protein
MIPVLDVISVSHYAVTDTRDCSKRESKAVEHVSFACLGSSDKDRCVALVCHLSASAIRVDTTTFLLEHHEVRHLCLPPRQCRCLRSG